MRLAALIHKVKDSDPLAINALEALNMATVDGAKCMGYDNLGTLESGSLAGQFILVNREGFNWMPGFNSISLAVYSGNSMDVDTVMINGKVVMRHKELLTIDVERMKREVSRVTDKLFFVCRLNLTGRDRFIFTSDNIKLSEPTNSP